MSDYRLEITVRGRVQGVCFRAFTRDCALAAGLSGWAKNRSDGSVHILLCGDREQVLAVCEQLRQGPPAARVDELVSEQWSGDAPSGFAIG